MHVGRDRSLEGRERDLLRCMTTLHRLQSHPWHGISAGDRAPDVVNVFVELVPTDTVKYEVD